MARKFGGILYYSAANLNFPTALSGGATAGNYNLVRNALGDVSLNNNAGAATVQFWCDIADYKRPFITFQYPGISAVQPVSNEFQNIFGTAAGGPSNPFSGGLTSPQFEVPPLPWGVAVIDIFAVYSVQTAALTAATLGLNRATFTENVAFTNTAVIAATGVALTTTASATACHVQSVAATNPIVFETANFSNISVEFLVTAAATSAVRVYGVGMHVAVCFD
jgi:hypothetical protein